jgi:hypothetical protein
MIHTRYINYVAQKISVAIMTSFLFSCSPSPKSAREKFTVPEFTNTGQVRVDGFYYQVATDWKPRDADEKKHYVRVFFLYDNGTANDGTGFTTNDTSASAIKAYVDSNFASDLTQIKLGWGRYSITNNEIMLEYFAHKSKGFVNMGLIKVTGRVENSEAIVVQRSLCSWCDGRPPELVFDPPRRYVFVQSDIKPDSSKAFFK